MSARSAALVVVAAGALSAVLYLNLTVQMTLLEFFPGPGITVDFEKMLGPDWAVNTFLLAGSFLVLFLLYGVVLAWVRYARPATAVRILLLFTALFAVFLVFIYPPQAVDFMHNLSDARTLWIFGDNAMTTAPVVHALPVAQSFDDEPAPYGPLWFLLLFPVRFVGEDNLQAQLHLLKLYTSLWYFGSAVLVYFVAKRVRPGREVFALALYAWNPFVVIRLAGNGHNDGTMFFFVLLALWLALSGRHRLVLPALVASVLVKWVSVLLIPPVLLALFLRTDDRRRFVADNAIGLGLSMALAVASFAYFWEGLDTFATLRDQAGRFYSSTPGAAMRFLVRTGLSEDNAASLAARMGLLSFVAVYHGFALVYVRRKRTTPELLAWLTLTLYAYLFLAVTWYRPWYMLWPVTLLPLVPGRWPVALLVATSFSGLFPDLIEVYRTEVQFLNSHYHLSDALPALVAFIPPLCVILACWIGRGWPFLTPAEAPSLTEPETS